MSQSALLTVFASSAATPASGLYAALFASLGATGCVMDTLANPPLLSNGGAVAVNGDPVGYVADGAGTGVAFEQTTSGAKPILVVTNGIPAIRLGSGIDFPALMSKPGDDTSSTMVFVFRPTAGDQTIGMHYYGGGNAWVGEDGSHWGGDLYAAVLEIRARYTSATPGTPFIVVVTFDARVLPRVCTLRVYSMAGTELYNGAGTIPIPITYGTQFTLGYSGASPQFQIAFALFATAVIESADRDAVVADLVARYGGWYA